MKHMHYRLANLRSKNNMTRENLGQKLGFTRQTIWNYENARRKPSFNTLIKYSHLFNVSIDYILKGDKNGMA